MGPGSAGIGGEELHAGGGRGEWNAMYQEAGFPGSRGKGGRVASGDCDTGTPSHSDCTGNPLGRTRFLTTQLESLWGR